MESLVLHRGWRYQDIRDGVNVCFNSENISIEVFPSSSGSVTFLLE
jgi:hypothetical protein